MSLHYGLHQPLRIYENLNHRNRNRTGDFGKVFKLLCPLNYILPFQIRRNIAVNTITSVVLVSTADGTETDITTGYIAGSQIVIFPFDTYDQIVHYGTQTLNTNIVAGEYYIRIEDGVNIWYTEDITYTDFAADLSNGCSYTKIVYWDTCDIGGMFYRMKEINNFFPQYKNIIYLDLEIGKPEYEYEEEGEEDELGQFFPDFKKVEKEYFIEGVFPEFMVDALTLIPLHISRTGVVEVLTQYGYTAEIDTFTVEPSWQGKYGVYALTELRFSSEFITKTNCCDDLEQPLTGCIRTSFYPKDCLLIGSTNYNNFEYDTGMTDPATMPLEDGDLVLIENAMGVKQMKRYDSTTNNYENLLKIVSAGADATVVDELNSGGTIPNTYLFNSASVSGWIAVPFVQNLISTGGNNYGIKGTSWRNCIVKMTARNAALVETEMPNITGQQFNAGTNVEFPAGTTEYRLTFCGLTCELYESAWLPVSTLAGGISSMQIGGGINQFRVS